MKYTTLKEHHLYQKTFQRGARFSGRYLSVFVLRDYHAKRLAKENPEKKPYNPIIISDDGLELIEFISVDCTSADGEWHSDSEIKIDKLGYVIRNGAKTKDFWDCRIISDKKPLRLKIRNICGDETVWAVR